jgi:hypothetical protein
MPDYKYLIIGGGMTADAAAAGIKEVDPEGSIGLIGAEPHPPYNRPPLSKGLWKGKPFEKIFRKGSQEGVDKILGRSVKSLDPKQQPTTRGWNTATTNYSWLRAVRLSGCLSAGMTSCTSAHWTITSIYTSWWNRAGASR